MTTTTAPTAPGRAHPLMAVGGPQCQVPSTIGAVT